MDIYRSCCLISPLILVLVSFSLSVSLFLSLSCQCVVVYIYSNMFQKCTLWLWLVLAKEITPRISLADSVGEKSDTATIEGAATSRQLDDESFYEQTTVEVRVKMVVCRKFITKKVNAKTGKVIYTAFRTVTGSFSCGCLLFTCSCRQCQVGATASTWLFHRLKIRRISCSLAELFFSSPT